MRAFLQLTEKAKNLIALAYIHKATEIDCSSVLKIWYACVHRPIALAFSDE